MDTHCQTATQKGSGECQNVWAVSSFWAKTGGGILLNKKVIGAVTYKLWLFSLCDPKNSTL